MIKITQRKKKLLDNANRVFSGSIEHHFSVYFSNLEVVIQYLYSYSSRNRNGVFSEARIVSTENQVQICCASFLFGSFSVRCD